MLLPLLVNSVLFLCIPELANAPPSCEDFSIRRHQLEAFVACFGGSLRSAFHLAHYSLFDASGAVHRWFHGHDRSMDPAVLSSGQARPQSGFLVRLSRSCPGGLSVVQYSEGEWSRRVLRCRRDGWTATAGQKLLGVYDSVTAYVAAHHQQQQPFPSPLSALYTATLALSDQCGLEAQLRPASPTVCLTPASADSAMSDESSGGAEAVKRRCSQPSVARAHAAWPQQNTAAVAAATSLLSPSPSLASYPVMAAFPLITDEDGVGDIRVVPAPSSQQQAAVVPDSPSAASTTAQSQSSSASSGSVDTGAEMEEDSAGSALLLSVDVPTASGCASYALHEFFYAIAVDDVLAVRAFIRFGSVPLTGTDAFGLTCVHIACAFNRVRILHVLRRHVPVSMLAAVTVRRISRSDDALLSAYSPANRHMPYFRTQLTLEAGSPCGAVACGYQSGGCLALIQNWLAELGVSYGSMQHPTHREIAATAV